MAKNIRNIDGSKIQDPSTIEALTYNNAAGAFKSAEVGTKRLPLGNGSGGFTTDATTVKKLPAKGKNLAVYNNSATLYAVTLGPDNTITALAPGAVDGGNKGYVGVPCTPNDWTFISCGEFDWVISQNAALLVFIADDDTYIRQEASK